jgi:hypothetical protein
MMFHGCQLLRPQALGRAHKFLACFTQDYPSMMHPTSGHHGRI